VTQERCTTGAHPDDSSPVAEDQPSTQAVHGHRLGSGRLSSGAIGAATVLILVIAVVAYNARFGALTDVGGISTGSTTPTDAGPTLVQRSAIPTDAEESQPAPQPTIIVGAPGSEREGVPATLHDRFWIAETLWPGGTGDTAYEAGQLGTTVRLVLPPAEWGLGADQGRVASTLTGKSGSTILVRDLLTGSLIRAIETPLIIWVNSGALVGTTLFFTGFADSSHTVDGGVWAVDVSSPDSVPKEIVPGGTKLSKYGDGAQRAPFEVSLTHKTVVSLVGAYGTAHADIIDVGTLTLRATLENEIVYAIGDEVVVVGRPGGMALLDMATGAQRWTLQLGTVYSAIVGATDVFVSASRATSQVVVAVNIGVGSSRQILTQSDPVEFMMGDLSTDGVFVLLPGVSIADSLGATGATTASLLDPVSGALTQDAFAIGTK
jgi:hypothetical protein